MTTKPAYQFDRAGHFAGVTDADESPLEPGVFLLPGQCTFTAPPDEWPADKWPRWDGFRWALVVKPTAPTETPADPVEKLQKFMAQNPDVAAMLNQTDGASLGGV